VTPLTAFNLDDPHLPDAIKRASLTSGGFPYSDKLEREPYEERLLALQIELVKLQSHLLQTGGRVVLIFEGRDAAGKGGSIEAYRANLNPRYSIIVALPKPSDREATQWYFQRYVQWMPAAHETVLFDRSWYNRAGVELVMGFTPEKEVEHFLKQAPKFEEMLVDDGIALFKFYLDIGMEMQMRRFHDRKHDPLKTWKLTAIDYKALDLWDAYSEARDAMLAATDTKKAPWTVIRANDKRRTHLAVIGTVLNSLDYKGKDEKAIGEVDKKIAISAEKLIGR
jgi:polyphosphate kinase